MHTFFYTNVNQTEFNYIMYVIVKKKKIEKNNSG